MKAIYALHEHIVHQVHIYNLHLGNEFEFNR